MKKLDIKEITVSAVVATIYVVLTWTTGSLSFGPIQFRIAEALVLLCFFNKKYFIPLVLGCIISNVFSPYGVIDVVLGATATAVALVGIMFSKNIIIASLFPVLSNGLIVGLEITLMEGVFSFPTFLLNFSTVALGEFVCVSIAGVLLFTILRKNDKFMELIDANQNIENKQDI